MNRTISNIFKNYQRYLFVFAMIFLVLLSSCPIKSLASNPVKTEYGAIKDSHSLIGNNLEDCIDATETKIAETVSIHTNDLLPVVIFTIAFLFLFSFRPESKENKHPLYSGGGKISNSIPIFLEYQKLLIHYSL